MPANGAVVYARFSDSDGIPASTPAVATVAGSVATGDRQQ